MVETTFNMFKVKYVDLREMIQNKCKNLKQNSSIDLYINLDSIIRVLMNSKTLEDYMKVSRESKYYELIAGVVNLAAHYRKFFTGNKHFNRIFFYTTYPFDGTFNNTDFWVNYRNSYAHMTSLLTPTNHTNMAVALEHSIPLIRTIFDFIDSVYLLYSSEIEASVLPYIVDTNTMRGDVRIILTGDIYDTQYIKHGFEVLYVKYSKTGKMRELFNEDNVSDLIKMDGKAYNDSKIAINHIPFILSCIGDKKRDIPRPNGLGLASVLKYLDKALSSHEIGATTDSLSMLLKAIPEGRHQEVMRNFNIVDVKTQAERFPNTFSIDIEDQIVDKFDNIGLRTLCDTFFVNTPLMVYEMNNHRNTRTNKSIFS